jgi:hypothetical protein
MLLYDACVQTIIRDPDLWYSRRLHVVGVVRRLSSRQPDFLFLLADPIRIDPHAPTLLTSRINSEKSFENAACEVSRR